MNRTDLMVDIETLSTDPNAAIVSIAGVVFDPHKVDLVVEDQKDPNISFYQTVKVGTNDSYGRHISAGTVEWWLTQTPEAIAALTNPTPLDLKKVMGLFCEWIRSRPTKVTRVWAKSPTFDCTILRNAATAVGHFWPFKYWQERDVRTIEDLAFPNPDLMPSFPAGEAHNALDDTFKQALQVQYYHLILKGKDHHVLP